MAAIRAISRRRRSSSSGNTDVALFNGTTAAAASNVDDTPKAERADYYDLGIEQKVYDGLMLGLDGFFKASHNLIDEGQFGAPIILTPFNYRAGANMAGSSPPTTTMAAR